MSEQALVIGIIGGTGLGQALELEKDESRELEKPSGRPIARVVPGRRVLLSSLWIHGI